MALNLKVLEKDSLPVIGSINQSSVESLAQQWAKKYLQNLQVDSSHQESDEQLDLSEIVSRAGREKTANKIMESLRSISAKAWNKTEALLSAEIKRHAIDANLINPWEVAGDSFMIYQKTLNVYTQQATLRPLSLVMKSAYEANSFGEQALEVFTEQVAPSQLARVISADIGAMRKKYTCIDPRVIGFVSMQFHYTSQMLLQPLDSVEQALVSAYFKVIDDHLYMPLQRAYDAAANHDYQSPALGAVQQLLPISTEIAKKICQRVIELHPNYYCLSGRLSDSVVKISSIRDVEMFQVYLWVCALEGNIAAIQQELFPLCVMLYPTLKVHWELIRFMLHLLRQEIQARLIPEQSQHLMPYFQVLWDMFSPDVFD
ncbi:hypothetical protein [Anabaena sp. CCY 9402-a]|uniref:hypothetical protein n=1 Tax=Anabaena sp. CCY 9402-a TaxID=3103867 RepID=UPI0039C60FF4